MGFVEAFKCVESLFTEAISISNPSLIDQNGVYLIFNNSKPTSLVEDRVSFILVLVANSFTGENGLSVLMDEYRNKIISNPFDIRVDGVSRAELLSSTLFSVAINISIMVNMESDYESI